jgi:hypothetical protein
MSRVFLLSPADCAGTRARQLLAPGAASQLAGSLRSAEGAPLGDVFAFVSGLYFRGKLAYARRFARPGDEAPPEAGGGVLVITAGAGLRAADTRITADAFRRFGRTAIDLGNTEYLEPLVSSARALERALPGDATFVLLGSIASPKYVSVLLGIFGDRLLFPLEFVGRGDMSRGGLMLRCVSSGEELDYARVAGAVRRGPRPPKLPSLGKPRGRV